MSRPITQVQIHERRCVRYFILVYLILAPFVVQAATFNPSCDVRENKSGSTVLLGQVDLAKFKQSVSVGGQKPVASSARFTLSSGQAVTVNVEAAAYFGDVPHTPDKVHFVIQAALGEAAEQNLLAMSAAKVSRLDFVLLVAPVKGGSMLNVMCTH